MSGAERPNGTERPALDSGLPSLTHTLGVLAEICEQDESLTPMDRGIRAALVETLRQAQGELRAQAALLDGARQDAIQLAKAQQRLRELRERRRVDVTAAGPDALRRAARQFEAHAQRLTLRVAYLQIAPADEVAARACQHAANTLASWAETGIPSGPP